MSALKQHLYRNPRLGYAVFIACTLLLALALLYAFRPLDLSPLIQCGPGLAYMYGLCIEP